MRTKTDEYIRARYKPMYCFMVSEVHDKSRDYRHHFMVSEALDDLELYFIGTDTRISTRISLCHPGFKGPAISSVSKNSDFQ